MGAKDTFFCKNNTLKTKGIQLNCDGKLLSLDEPVVMGILNLTPDSFFDGGKLNSISAILKQAEKHLTEGAAILDIGGYSSRPNAKNIDKKEEWERLKQPLQALKKEFPTAIISIDTFRASIAQKSFDDGAAIINDISGGQFDYKMFETIANINIPYILMHTQGNPQTMQNKPKYNNILEDTFNYFNNRINQLHSLGVKDIILDPGFGFGKTIAHNYKILSQLDYLSPLLKPLLVGLSRKSMIYKILKNTPENALNGTTVLNTIALLKNVKILRVHDVKEAMETIQLCGTLSGNKRVE